MNHLGWDVEIPNFETYNQKKHIYQYKLATNDWLLTPSSKCRKRTSKKGPGGDSIATQEGPQVDLHRHVNEKWRHGIHGIHETPSSLQKYRKD